ncbi:NUDIX domain-containing protein [Gryllotalpicola reticulitermitis]|uniref:NUDIX domain-containing protein n=1 Tax=Gryllotalpicola reticulitermitis TaxID=1184153 RepID=A0ABV8Q330_9MICO
MGSGIARDEVAVAVIVRDGKVFLGHRHPRRRWYPNCWDLIGGHIEQGDTAAQAIVRECREELSIVIHDARPIENPVELPTVNLHTFLVSSWDGDLINSAPDEHDALAWFTPDQVSGLRLADHSYSVWLPEVIASASQPS